MVCVLTGFVDANAARIAHGDDDDALLVGRGRVWRVRRLRVGRVLGDTDVRDILFQYCARRISLSARHCLIFFRRGDGDYRDERRRVAHTGTRLVMLGEAALHNPALLILESLGARHVALLELWWSPA